MQGPFTWTIIIASALLWLCFSIVQFFVLRRKMPPGPIGLPFIGNTHQIPPVKPWWKFEELNKQYGPVMSIFLGRTPVIVLGTAQAAWDLLEKRSELYSSRPRFIVAGEIFSDNMRGLMAPYGESWRKWRKILHGGFHARRSLEYRDMQSQESKLAMYQILTDPRNYERHILRYAASVAVFAAYGKRIESIDEWIVKEMNESMEYLISVNLPGKYLVESWPWLLKLPRALQWFRREPEQRKERDVKLLLHLLDNVKAGMEKGTLPDCLASQTLAMQDKTGLSYLEIAYAVSSPFGAGIETTSATIFTFILAMLHYPEVMAKAHAEIDAVVGDERMPEFDDYDRLPYIRALVNETLRWRPVAILGGTPHAVIADDVYNGMLIPKGSTIFANFAGIMRDPGMFPDPERFMPERFINTTDPRLLDFNLPFGFGRRICPGMHLANNSVFLNIARLLWAFDILPPVDKDGLAVLPDPWNYTDGFNSRPVSFDCRFLPRGQKVKDCIMAEYEKASDALSKWT